MRVVGKGQLIERFEVLLPFEFTERKDVTYIELCKQWSNALLYVTDVSKYRGTRNIMKCCLILRDKSYF